MTIWELDFYRCFEKDDAGRDRWELLICDAADPFQHSAFCLQSQASAEWVQAQLQQLFDHGIAPPQTVRVFRPQTLNLLEPACKALGIELQPTRRTPALKQWIAERSFNSHSLDRPAPCTPARKPLGRSLAVCCSACGGVSRSLSRSTDSSAGNAGRVTTA